MEGTFHTYREANKCADWLANFALNLPSGCYVFDSATVGMSSLILADIQGLTSSRLIHVIPDVSS